MGEALRRLPRLEHAETQNARPGSGAGVLRGVRVSDRDRHRCGDDHRRCRSAARPRTTRPTNPSTRS